MIQFFKSLSFEEIAPFWHRLWSNNPANVKPVNTATFMYTYGINGFDKRIPFGPVNFFGIVCDDQVVGVFSTYKSSETYWMRARGLWVEPAYRGRGFGKALIEEAKRNAIRAGCDFLWAYPRCETWPMWEQLGFKSKGRIDFPDTGPHVWAYAKVQ
jgi:GNAT superfamily N-acetyltransferase